MAGFNYHDFKLNGNRNQSTRSSSFGQGFPKPVTTSTLFSTQSSVFGARSSAMQESPQFQNLNRQSAGNMQRYASQRCFGQRAGQTQNAAQMWNAQSQPQANRTDTTMKGVSGILDAVFKGVKDIKGQVDAKKNGTEAPALSDYSTPSSQSSSSASAAHSSSYFSYTEPRTKGECVDMMDNVLHEQMKISRKIADLEEQMAERSIGGDTDDTAYEEAEIAALESRYNELDGIHEKLSQKMDGFYT